MDKRIVIIEYLKKGIGLKISIFSGHAFSEWTITFKILTESSGFLCIWTLCDTGFQTWLRVLFHREKNLSKVNYGANNHSLWSLLNDNEDGRNSVTKATGLMNTTTPQVDHNLWYTSLSSNCHLNIERIIFFPLLKLAAVPDNLTIRKLANIWQI